MEGLILWYQMCLGMWDRGTGGWKWGMPWRDREGMAVEQGIGKGGNRGGAESQACRVAAKPTVMLATGIGCCGPQVVLVRTSKGQLWTWKHNSFPPVYPVFCLYYTTFWFLLLSGFLFRLLPMRGTSKVLQNLWAQKEWQHACRVAMTRCTKDLREESEG